MPHPTIPSAVRRLGLRAAALVVPALFVAATAGPAIVERERTLACTAIDALSPDAGVDLGGLADEGRLPLTIAPSDLPPGLREIAEHVKPVFGTDGSRDILAAAKTHDAELNREAAEGMASAPRAAGGGEGTAAAQLDESIAAARTRRAPRPADGPGPRRRK